MHVRLTGLRMVTDNLDPSSEPPSFPSVGRSDSKTGRLAINVAYSILRSPPPIPRQSWGTPTKPATGWGHLRIGLGHCQFYYLREYSIGPIFRNRNADSNKSERLLHRQISQERFRFRVSILYHPVETINVTMH